MSAASQGVGCGVVLGIVLVLLAQQFGFVSLSGLAAAIEYLVLGAIVGAILFGIIGWALGRRYVSRHPAVESPAGTPPSTPP
ncbi:MAG: hypothetical protein WBE40_08405 [Thermoplasmata archaeon]